VVRRRLAVKRLDPWSVLKFGAVANVALLAIGLLVASVVWFIVDRLQLVDQVCSIAADVGFTQCGLNAGNLFRALVLLGLLWVVIQTAVLVFLAFLHNLIADLTGGIVLGVIDDAPAVREEPRRVTTANQPPARDPRPRAADRAPDATGPVHDRRPAPQDRRSAPQDRTRAPGPPTRAAREERRGGGDELFGSR
jgi:hypothetical protein